MELILQFALVLVLIMSANVVVRSQQPQLERLFDRFLLLLHIPVFFFGLTLIFVDETQLSQLGVQTESPLLTNPLALGISLQVIAIWGILVSLHSTRASLARLMPIRPDSAVHSLALVCAGWLVGSSLIQLTQTSVEEIVEAIGTFSLANVVLQETFFALIGLLGVGLGIRRKLPALLQRLGLEPMTRQQVLLGVAWIFALVIIQALAGAVWSVIDPEQAELIGELNFELQAGLDTVWEWLLLSLAAGIGEEILFRGALQPVLGLWVTSFLFAIVHVQYGLFTPATLALLIIGLALGFIRKQHNTTTAIFVHAGYDFVLGLLSLLVASQVTGG